MEANSDGRNITRRKKHEECDPTDVKPGNSIEIIDLSHADINKIIGIDNKKPKQPEPYLDDSKQERTADNKSKESFNTPDANLANELIFKPRISFFRTPPKNMETYNEQQDKSNNDENEALEDEYCNNSSQKRIRSSSSPATMENRSKIKKPNSESGFRNNEQVITNEQYALNNTEIALGEILDALQRIHENLELMPQNEAKKTSSDLFTVHKHVTNLAFKIGQTEKTNLELKNKIRELSTVKNVMLNSDIHTPPPLSKTPYYCDVVRNVPAGNNPTLNSNVTEWKSPPPQNPKHETIVRIKENSDSRKVMQEIKDNLRASNVDGHFKRIKPLPSGSVIIECHDASQQKKLKETLEKANKNASVKNIFNLDPMIKITGVLKGHTPESFINEFVVDNPDILDTFGENVMNQFKYVTKRDCRNNSKENWIFQTPPALFKWLIRNNNLVLDLCPAFVQEYTNVSMCFKCCLFGHVAKHCTAKDCCHKCGSAHNSTQCTADVLDCPNCKRSNLSQRNHSARNSSCPVYMQRIARLQQQTNYSTPGNF